MGKFGKKKNIELTPLNYSILLAGIGGIGKTTLSKEYAEKIVGEDGYIHFNIGREGGASALSNFASEDIESWEKLEEVIDDIVENKDSDYPDLKLVIWDSLDELLVLGEKETIRIYNRDHKDNKAETINGCFGGFGRGLDYNLNLILDAIWKLKSVGVQSFIIAHTKRADIVDPITQTTYSQLTADAMQRYFNNIKNKMDIVAMAYIDRDIVTEKTGRKNIKNKDITINKVTNETRVISFRDNNYAVDSKCRFADIVDKIPFDTDEFIKAINDAIIAEQKKSGISLTEAKKIQKKKDEERAKESSENSKLAKESKVIVERNEELVESIKPMFLEADTDTKNQIKDIMKKNKVSDFKDVENIPTKVLEEIYSLLSE